MSQTVQELMEPGVAYRQQNLILRAEPNDMQILRLAFPRMRKSLGESMRLPSVGKDDDGLALVPSFRGQYSLWLPRVYRACALILYEHGFEIDHYLDGWNENDIQLQPDACLVHTRWLEPALMSVQFGHRYNRESAIDAVELMKQNGEQPLEPGVALIALTALAMRGGLKGHMRVECPGALYSPGGKSRFDDVLRWDVFPPSRGVKGRILLDWNWRLRRRHLHGSASGKIIPPAHWRII